jgi:hypothetical protein
MTVRRAARLWCDQARRVPRPERSPKPESKRKQPAFSPKCTGRDGLRRDRRRRRGPRKVRYSKRGAPGDIHRRRLEYLRPIRRLSIAAGSGPGIVRESHTPGKSREYGQMTIRAEFVPGREPPDTRTRPSRRSSWFHTLHPSRNMPRPDFRAGCCRVNAGRIPFWRALPSDPLGRLHPKPPHVCTASTRSKHNLGRAADCTVRHG